MGDGVQDAVDAVEVRAHAVGEGGELVRVGDVEFDDRGLVGKAAGEPLDEGGAPVRGQHDPRALLLCQPGHGVGDGTFADHTGDDQPLAVEQAAHPGSSQMVREKS
ncbi:hypothetical protein SRIMM317S_02867 [Streptomyces rimosus subsp. rimosus]